MPRAMRQGRCGGLRTALSLPARKYVPPPNALRFKRHFATPRPLRRTPPRIPHIATNPPTRLPQQIALPIADKPLQCAPTPRPLRHTPPRAFAATSFFSSVGNCIAGCRPYSRHLRHGRGVGFRTASLCPHTVRRAGRPGRRLRTLTLPPGTRRQTGAFCRGWPPARRCLPLHTAKRSRRCAAWGTALHAVHAACTCQILATALAGGQDVDKAGGWQGVGKACKPRKQTCT